ncbi:Ig-like domain-containing protein, partial [Caballeronia sordidicola]|uniref:Ig-like domain-containing protein n=1 Tax=Caballeronia sordidicola TaxID=196367 RepID=UPI00211AF6DE
VPKNGSTDDNHPAISGTGVAGDVVHVIDKGVEIGSTTVNPSGNWTFTPVTPLADGAHDITATQTNPATGATSNPSTDFPFKVDTTVPPVPTISGATDNVGPVVGPIPAHGTTDDNDPVIAGKGVPGDIVHVLDNGVDIGSTTVNPSGDWTFKPTVPLADGPHDITAEQSNPATGATSGPSQDFPFNVDTTTPVAPSITQVLDAVGAVTGPVPINGTTDDNDPVISGKGVAGDIVHVMDKGVEIGSTTVSGTGDWSFKPATALADGAHDLTATQANPATGKLSLPSNDWTFTVDTALPKETVAISSLSDHTSGANIPAGSSTSDTSPVVHGSVSSSLLSGETLVIYRDGQKVGVATMNGTSWTFNDSGLTIGNHTYTAQVENSMGHGPTSDPYAFSEISPLPAETVSISNLIDDSGSSNVNVPSGGQTYDTSPIVNGTVSSPLLSGETLAVYLDGNKVGNATVNGTSWSFNGSGVLPGNHTYTAQVENSVGHGFASNQYNFTELAGNGGKVAAFYVRPNYTGTGTGTYTFEMDLTGCFVNGVQVTVSSAYITTQDGVNDYLAFPTQIPGTQIWSIQLPTGVGAAKNAYGLTWNVVGISGGVVDTHSITSLIASPGVWFAFNAIPAGSGLTTPLTGVHATLAVQHDASQVASVEDATLITDNGQAHHTVVGEHDAFTGTTGHDTVDLNADPTSYFKETTAHIQGSTVHPTEAAGVTPAANTLHLTGDHQVLDLTSLTGQTAAAKISGIEVIDLGGHTNHLNLSLTDVLNLGEQDLFQKDGKQQMMVNGSDGDSVDLSNAHIAGVADGVWHQEGTAQVGGVTYNVYEHSGAHTELLIQQGVQIALHN